MQNYNPYENMLNTLDVAAEKLGYTRNDYEVLRHPERELKVSVPLQLDNGEVRVYEAIVANTPHCVAVPRAVFVFTQILMKRSSCISGLDDYKKCYR